MATLHLYGDSFGVDAPGINWSWHRRLAKMLGMTYHNKCIPGTATTFAIKHLVMDQDAKMNAGDIVVVILTQFTREWLLYEHPDFANFYFMTWGKGVIERDKEKFIKDYILKAKRHEIDLMRHWGEIAFLNELYRGLEREGIQLIVLAGFPFGHPAMVLPDNPFMMTGNMTDNISACDFVSDDALCIWYGLPHGDMRLNHMTKDTHSIFAQAMFDSIRTGAPLHMENLGITPQIDVDNIHELQAQGQVLTYEQEAAARQYAIDIIPSMNQYIMGTLEDVKKSGAHRVTEDVAWNEANNLRRKYGLEPIVYSKQSGSTVSDTSE